MSGEAVSESALSELMVRYQSGDTTAFEALYAALAPALGRYLRSLVRDSVRADDLLQETFLQIHRARQTYTPPRPVKPWVYAIARHVHLMALRSRVRRARHEVAPVLDLPDVPIPPEVSGLADQEAVRHALEHVAPDHREALVMHHLSGLSFKEIGRVLGISEGAAKVRAHRGMVTLREVLGGGNRR